MENDVVQFCKSCHGCQLVSTQSKPDPMSRNEFPSGLWQHVARDYLGLPSGDYLLVFVDYYSSWVEVVSTKSTAAEKTITMFKGVFCAHGNPLSVTADNGPQFRSEIFNKYLRQNGIEHHSTTPLWPQANGEIERQNSSLMKGTRIAQTEQKD
ncbi:uncharacterized protein K02A2.6-like [Ylistrum balloti]|uniref:uncharacterized protein K02A2.6-like n=1 Tax=Ylistrum balloti TaxID=509963 RepID=UPI00290593F8|nr:uncharacterized protein K02A2.6-like [Ylistrum balloti]